MSTPAPIAANPESKSAPRDPVAVVEALVQRGREAMKSLADEMDS